MEQKLSAKDKLTNGERTKIVGLRGIQNSDLAFISKWIADPETNIHLNFAPEPPKDLKNRIQVKTHIEQLEHYYKNKDEDPRKITPIVGLNSALEPVSALTIRWRGDPYVPKDRRITSFETFIVDPQARCKGVGIETLSAALDIAFNKYKGYGGEPAREVRVWVFTDATAGNYNININFFRKFGFENLPGNWREYAAKRQIENADSRDAMWFKLTREKWDHIKHEHPDLANHPRIDVLSLRI